MALTNDDLKAIAGLLKPIQNDIHMIKGNITTLQKDTQELKDDVKGLKDDVQVLKDDVQVLRHDTQKLDNRLTHIELTLENETNRGIKIIAEGHLDLNRKLNDALKVENEKELLLLRVNHLENEMRFVKARLDHST